MRSFIHPKFLHGLLDHNDIDQPHHPLNGLAGVRIAGKVAKPWDLADLAQYLEHAVQVAALHGCIGLVPQLPGKREVCLALLSYPTHRPCYRLGLDNRRYHFFGRIQVARKLRLHRVVQLGIGANVGHIGYAVPIFFCGERAGVGCGSGDSNDLVESLNSQSPIFGKGSSLIHPPQVENIKCLHHFLNFVGWRKFFNQAAGLLCDNLRVGKFARFKQFKRIVKAGLIEQIEGGPLWTLGKPVQDEAFQNANAFVPFGLLGPFAPGRIA